MIKLYPVQQKQVDEANRNCMLIMGMGTGKSFTACGVYDKWSSAPLVILCPKTVYDTKQWDNTIATYFGDLAPEYEVYKTDGINKLPDDYFTDKYVIIDEGHKYKALSTARGAKLRVMLSHADGFCFLTGTPANGTLERTPDGYLLHGGKWEDMANYMAIFEFWKKVNTNQRTIFDVYHEKFKGKPFTFKTITAATSSRGIMQTIRLSARVLRGKNGARFYNNYLYEPFHPVLSRWLDSVASDVVTLDDVAQLPTVTEHVVEFKVSAEYKKSQQSYNKDDKIIFDSDMERRVWQRQNQNTKAKTDWLKEFCDNTDYNTVIFYNFNTELEALRDTCSKAGKEVFEINGSSNEKSVALAKDKINEVGSRNRVVLVQVASGGAGLELTGAKIAIWWSLPDSFINFDQSRYRNYRIGQDKKVIRYQLIVKGTVDVAIKYSLDNKQDFKGDEYED